MHPTLAASLDASFPRSILFDEARGKTVDDGQVRRPMSHSNAAVVLAKDNIKTPMETISHVLMSSGGFCKSFGIITWQAGNEVPCLPSNLVSHISFGLNHSETGEFRPFGFFLKPVHANNGSVRGVSTRPCAPSTVVWVS